MNTRLRLAAYVTLLLATVAACASPPTEAPLAPAPTATPKAEPATPTLRPFGGTVEKGQITSTALAGNLLGDPTTRDFYVYLPQGYDSSTKRYPVVYVLHWYTGDETQALRTVSSSMDWLIDKGEVGDMIFVFPDASNKLGGSMYWSSPTIGDYETYITKELVQQIDATYRTLPNPESRGVMGCSMGGMGALHLGLKYPDVFGVSAPMAAMYDWEHDPEWEIARRFFDVEPHTLGEFKSLSFTTQFFIAVAAATAANPDNPPFYLDMPFEIVDGEARIVPDVFSKVNAMDPMVDVSAYLNQPIRLRNILIYHDTEIGQAAEDAAHSLEAARQFHETLTKLGIPNEYAEVDARHCEFDYSPVLEFMAANLTY